MELLRRRPHDEHPAIRWPQRLLHALATGPQGGQAGEAARTPKARRASQAASAALGVRGSEAAWSLGGGG
ncbi:MAG: hypothetical protein EBX95_13710, partial [Acidimicrobiia bacterium]|nr:hypothetical protein [Acidimicrobiia bacterium]